MSTQELASIYEKVNGWSPLTFKLTMEELERFANAVQKAKCEELAKKIEAMPFGATSDSFAVWVREQA